jgi:hypothetical protein
MPIDTDHTKPFKSAPSVSSGVRATVNQRRISHIRSNEIARLPRYVVHTRHDVE